MFYLYNIKMQGWVSAGVHPFTSDLGEAKKFTEEEMTTRVRAGKSPTGLAIIPVDVAWLESLA